MIRFQHQHKWKYVIAGKGKKKRQEGTIEKENQDGKFLNLMAVHGQDFKEIYFF